MGWYRVTKTIKGHLYSYDQRTYRQGGKVKTENRYVGPAGGGAGRASKSTDKRTGEAASRPSVRPVTTTTAVAITPVTTTPQRFTMREKLEQLGGWYRLRNAAGGWVQGRRVIRHYRKYSKEDHRYLLDEWNKRLTKCEEKMKSAKSKRQKSFWSRETKEADCEWRKLAAAILLIKDK